MTPLARLVRESIDPLAVLRRVCAPANGAVVLFLGAVREVNDGRGVTGIDYAAYDEMALRELTSIAEEARERFPGADVAVDHRLGTLAVEEISVAVAVGHPHRDAAYAVSRWVIEELKRRVPIWKREHYADGTRAWVDPTRASAAVVA